MISNRDEKPEESCSVDWFLELKAGAMFLRPSGKAIDVADLRQSDEQAVAGREGAASDHATRPGNVTDREGRRLSEIYVAAPVAFGSEVGLVAEILPTGRELRLARHIHWTILRLFGEVCYCA